MTQLTEDVFAVEVPEGRDAFAIESVPEEGIWELLCCNLSEYNEPTNEKYIRLPPGTWQLLCTTKEATRGDAFGLVKSHYSRSASYNPVLGHYQTSGSTTTFMDYINGHCTLDSPLDSLRSLITSKGLDGNKNYVLLKKK